MTVTGIEVVYAYVLYIHFNRDLLQATELLELSFNEGNIFSECILLVDFNINVLVPSSHNKIILVNALQGFIQDQTIASHTCSGGHTDVNC